MLLPLLQPVPWRCEVLSGSGEVTCGVDGQVFVFFSFFTAVSSQVSASWLQLIQRRCETCSGSGLVTRGRFQRKCSDCGGFFPWRGADFPCGMSRAFRTVAFGTLADTPVSAPSPDLCSSCAGSDIHVLHCLLSLARLVGSSVVAKPHAEVARLVHPCRDYVNCRHPSVSNRSSCRPLRTP